MLPEASGKLWTSVRNNSVRDHMKSDYLIEVQLGIISRMIVCSNRNKVSRLGQTVYNYLDRVMIFNSGRKSNDEIHTYLLPFLTWNRKWLKQSSFHVHGFNSTASITPSNVCNYLFPHLGPPIVGLQIVIHLTAT
jgi:hypothetical protein